MIDVSNPKDPNVVVGELETGSCQDIGALASKAGDPAPGETVFVKVFVSPPAKGCKITYSLVGTDGYAQADTLITDIEGGASFNVPGGAQGVVDEIDFKTENGITLTETYTF